MIKRLFLILSILLVLILPISILKISAKEDNYPIFKLNIIAEQPIGTLIIKRLNLKENLYKIGSSKNNIEEHVTILKESIAPNQANSTFLLAAHSGSGKAAYFEKLDELKQNDKIELIYKNTKYTYYVKDIFEEKKDGYININKEVSKQLVLTTCSPNRDGYQLIVNCIEKESN